MPETLTLDSVIAMGRSGDATRFINVATEALNQDVAPDDLVLLLMQRLTERGLLALAHRVAERLSPAVRSHPEFAGMLQALTVGSNNGLVPWERLAPVFATNLAALRRRYAWADNLAAEWAANSEQLELHATTDNTWQVLDRAAGSFGTWRPIFGDHQPQPPLELLKAKLKNQVLPALAIDGVGQGQHLPWLYEATNDTLLGATALIYQTETELLALAVALHLVDWTGLIADDRVRLCCGPDAFEQLERAIAAEEWNIPPTLVSRALPWHGEAAQPAEPVLKAIEARVEAERRALKQAVAAGYAERGAAWWHRRYAAALSGAEPPLRVLAFTCRFTTVLQYATRDLLSALRSIGCQTRLLIEPNDHARVPPRQRLTAIRDFQPDLVLMIDHPRSRHEPSLIDEVPVLTWVQDRLPWLFDRAVGERIGPLDFLMGFGFSELVKDYGYPAERVMPCEMATDPAALLPAGADGNPLDPAELDEPADPVLSCDVAYATNYGRTAEMIYRETRARCNPAGMKLLDALYEELVARLYAGLLNGGLDSANFIATMQRAAGVELSAAAHDQLLGDIVRPMADQLLREQTITWLADWAEQTGRRFNLYGNGWERHPRFSRYSRGYLEHGQTLGRAFRAAKVNVHAGCNLAFHQRVLDGLSAGGFFLIRRHASDVAFATTRKLNEIVRARGLGPGDVLPAADLPPELAAEWAALCRMRGFVPDAPYQVTEKVVELMNRKPEDIVLPVHVWPDLPRVCFGSATELAERLEHFLSHPEKRRAVAANMRARVLERFSYTALMHKVLHWMADVLGRGACDAAHSRRGP
jgi:hypothetical protein